jgi:hypothetical protein
MTCDSATKPSSALPVSTNWKCLRDVGPLHDLGEQCVIDPQCFQSFDRCSAVGGGCRIGDCDLVEFRIARGLLADQRFVCAEEDEFPDRVGEQAVGAREAAVGKLLRRFLISRQEHMKGRPLGDLRVKLTVAPKLKIARFSVLLSKSCAISLAGSVKFAATATFTLAACASAEINSETTQSKSAVAAFARRRERN